MTIVCSWFLDGNFAMAPPVFGQGQLYVIRAPLDSTYVTCVYALMAGKSQAEYVKMLQSVVDACRQLGFHPDPSVVVTDFELAVMRATTDVLGSHIQHAGCFYHLTQSTWRKVCQFCHTPYTHLSYFATRKN